MPEIMPPQRLRMAQVKQIYTQERKRLKQLLDRRQSAERLLGENGQTRETVEALKEKDQEDAILPIGGGVFVKGTIRSNAFQRLLPGDAVLPVPYEQLIKDLEEREHVLKEEIERVDKELQHTSANINQLNQVREAMTNALKKSKK